MIPYLRQFLDKSMFASLCPKDMQSEFCMSCTTLIMTKLASVTNSAGRRGSYLAAICAAVSKAKSSPLATVVFHAQLPKRQL